MNITSIGSSTPIHALVHTPEATEHDGDGDDSARAAPTPAPAATVNSSGQTIGKTLNVTA